MPGICGIAANESPDLRSLVDAMASRLRHYPWQTASTWAPSGGSAVLSSVTLSSPGTDTLAEMFGVALAFDGEIYAAKDARAHLVRHGVHFHGDSTVELLMQGLSREGTPFLASLHGCFAAAIWDVQRQTLTLVSDRFGMRPLYWAAVNGTLVFASEIKALLTVPGVMPHDVARRDSPSSSRLASILATGRRLTRSRCCRPPRSLSSTWQPVASRIAVVRRRRSPQAQCRRHRRQRLTPCPKPLSPPSSDRRRHRRTGTVVVWRSRRTEHPRGRARPHASHHRQPRHPRQHRSSGCGVAVGNCGPSLITSRCWTARFWDVSRSTCVRWCA